MVNGKSYFALLPTIKETLYSLFLETKVEYPPPLFVYFKSKFNYQKTPGIVFAPWTRLEVQSTILCEGHLG